MNKRYYLPLFNKKTVPCICLALVFLFSGCADKKLEREMQKLKSENQSLKSVITQLESEIKIAQEIDQYYFTRGQDSFRLAQKNKSKENYHYCIEMFSHLIEKFPNSNYISQSKSYISKAQKGIEVVATLENGVMDVEKAIKENDQPKALNSLEKIKDILEAPEYRKLKDKTKRMMNKSKEEKAISVVEKLINEHNFDKALVELEKDETISQEKYDELKKRINAFKNINQSNHVTLAQLEENPKKYDGIKVRIGPVKLMENQVSNSYFMASPSKGQNYDQYEVSYAIEVYYDKLKDKNTWKNFAVDSRPIAFVNGIYWTYDGKKGEGYIEAQEIILSNE